MRTKSKVINHVYL